MDSPRVFLALPHYGEIHANTFISILTASKKILPVLAPDSASLLCFVFNRLFAAYLTNQAEKGYTHFAMIHSDMAPTAGWLDTMLEEMEKHDLDVISAVAPIKDERGLTSCGWAPFDTGRVTRFTVKEVQQFPTTFTAADCGHPNDMLMVNTGCWVARQHRWFQEFPGFNIQDAIVRDPATGKITAHVLSEDWNWSQWLARRGDVKVGATKAFRCAHHGKATYWSDVPGTYDTDHGDVSEEELKKVKTLNPN